MRLKITGLKTFVVNAGSSNWVFCKVYTNQGLVGLGEGSVTSKEATVVAAIMEHERFLIGKDPTDIELLWQGMFRYPRWRGGPILNSAISAVEIALWDILGQALGVPIYKLLGGAARQRIRMYLDVGSTPEAFLESEGGRLHGGQIRTSSRSRKTSSVRPMRYAKAPQAGSGPQSRRRRFRYLHRRARPLTTPMAVDFCTRVEELRPFFVEEATQLEDIGELALLRQRRRSRSRQASGRSPNTASADFCSRHLVDYVQPDVCHAGGILELKKIGVLAETYRVEMAPHNPQSHVSTMASLHVDATTPACDHSGILARQARLDSRICSKAARCEIKDGFAELPDSRVWVHAERESRRRASLQARDPAALRLLRRRRGRSVKRSAARLVTRGRGRQFVAAIVVRVLGVALGPGPDGLVARHSARPAPSTGPGSPRASWPRSSSRSASSRGSTS